MIPAWWSKTDTPLRQAARPWLPWLALGVTAGAAGLAAGHWWWIALLAAPAAVAVDGRWPYAARALLALAALTAGGWLGSSAPGTSDLGPRLYDVTGTVGSSLYLSHHQGFILAPEKTADSSGYLPRRLFVSAPPMPGMLEGDRVQVRGLWRRDTRGERLDAVSIERVGLRETGVRGPAWSALDRIEQHRELAGALLLGMGRPPEQDLFRRTGLVHVLAVSGMHLALAAAMGAWLLRQVGVGWLTRQLALAALLIGYTWLTAASPATVRALAMALAMTLYALTAREPHRLGAVSLAALALVLWDPGVAHDLGFQLSLAAVLGIMTLGLDLMHLRQRWLPLAALPLTRPTWRVLLFATRTTCDGLAIGTAASLATAPVLVATFGTISPWSPLTTLLVSPPTTVALWTGLPLLGLAGAWPNGPWEGLYLILESALSSLVWAVTAADQLPGRVPVPPAPIIVLLLWPLVFVPCEPVRMPAALLDPQADHPATAEPSSPSPWPRATLIRLAIVAVLIGLWRWL